MEKRISYAQFQSVRSVAKACNPLMMKRENVKAKIEKLVEEYKGYDTQIQTLEAGIKQILGFRVEELVKKVIEPDANGNRVTKYLPTSIVTYDEQHKQYVISVPEETNAPAAEEETAEEEAEEEAQEEQVESVY